MECGVGHMVEGRDWNRTVLEETGREEQLGERSRL
jgi:hypothetical protein